MENIIDLESLSIEELEKMREDLYFFLAALFPKKRYKDDDLQKLLNDAIIGKVTFFETKEIGKTYGIYVDGVNNLSTENVNKLVPAILTDKKVERKRPGLFKKSIIFESCSFTYLNYVVKNDYIDIEDKSKINCLYKNVDINEEAFYNFDQTKLNAYYKALDKRLEEHLKSELENKHDYQLVNRKRQEVIEIIEKKREERDRNSTNELKDAMILEKKYINKEFK